MIFVTPGSSCFRVIEKNVMVESRVENMMNPIVATPLPESRGSGFLSQTLASAVPVVSANMSLDMVP